LDSLLLTSGDLTTTFGIQKFCGFREDKNPREVIRENGKRPSTVL
jgi:hypothetical protein